MTKQILQTTTIFLILFGGVEKAYPMAGGCDDAHDKASCAAQEPSEYRQHMCVDGGFSKAECYWYDFSKQGYGSGCSWRCIGD